MVKKLLVGLAGAAVVLSGAAFANGGSAADSGYAAPMAASDSDNGSGIYLGVNAGYGLTHWRNVQGDSLNAAPSVTLNVSNTDGFAGGALLGYQFNKNFGLEGAWEYLPSNVSVTPFTSGSSLKVKNWAADFAAVLSAPIQDKFGLFGKLGVGYLRSNNAPTLNTATQTSVTGQNLGSWNIAVGAGAYYDITSQVRASLAWQRYEGHTMINGKYQPNPDLFLAGLQYRFGSDLFGGM